MLPRHHAVTARTSILATALLLAAASLPPVANADTQYPAKLAGHALLPAKSFIEAPADAPHDLRLSGKFTQPGQRAELPGTVMGKSKTRPTGVSLPFSGQPVQGHSGIKRMADGSFWIITDNGFGSKANSPDAMLFLNHYTIDWNSGAFQRKATVFLHDPDKKIPFRIVHEGTEKRYLTGADFDIEGFQIIGDKIWIGDEFGPFLLRTDMTGKVEAIFETLADGKPVRSPDHPTVTAANPDASNTAVNLGRSKGYEGLAASLDGRFLYGLLEGPLWDAEKRSWEKTADGRTVLRILEFSVADTKWTGRFWHYPLEAGAKAIGDFNCIDGNRALVIERDNGEGTADLACTAGQAVENCFDDLARFKRVVLIDMNDTLAGGPVRKIGHIDLMAIDDPEKKARKPLTGGKLAFPFFTIENVDRVDERHIIVGNDNNLPFSTSRQPNQADDNEMVLLEVTEFLQAR